MRLGGASFTITVTILRNVEYANQEIDVRIYSSMIALADDALLFVGGDSTREERFDFTSSQQEPWCFNVMGPFVF